MYRLASLTILRHPLIECSPENPVKLDFHCGANLILGPNGSGKTTLLKLIEGICCGDIFFCMRRIGLGVSVQATFELSKPMEQYQDWSLHFTVHTFSVNDASETIGTVGVNATVALSWRNSSMIRAEVSLNGPEIRYTLASGETYVHKPTARSTSWWQPSDSLCGIISRDWPLEHQSLLGAADAFHSAFRFYGPLRLDERTDYPDSLLTDPPRAQRPPLLTIQPTGLHASCDYGYHKEWRTEPYLNSTLEFEIHGDVPADALQRIHDQILLHCIQPSEPLPQFTERDCSALQTFCRLTGAVGVQVLLTDLRSYELNPQSHHGSTEMSIHWPNGETTPASQLTFGQRRLLAFLWLLSSRVAGPMLLDDVTNGLHWEWVQECINEMGDRQSFHAVQNPLMINALVEREVDVIRKQLIHCSRLTEGRLLWRQPASDEAREISRARTRLIRPISEQLAGMGLW